MDLALCANRRARYRRIVAAAVVSVTGSCLVVLGGCSQTARSQLPPGVVSTEPHANQAVSHRVPPTNPRLPRPTETPKRVRARDAQST